MSIILGIDPGKKGALALLDTDTRAVTVHDMPGTTGELHDLIAGLPEIRLCVLEKLTAGPKMGGTSIAAMFEGYGVLKGALAWRSIPMRDVRPDKWKAAIGVTADKISSRQKAQQVFPDAAAQFARVKDDGRAEACLIALYGFEQGWVR